MSNCFIILAAGKSNRFISKIPKPYIRYKGDILINHSINKAILSKKFSKIVVAINKGHKKYIKKLSKNKSNEILFCHEMNNVVSQSIKYISGSTSIYTSASDSMSQGSGVCQDFAHILISLARKNNFPARYISGFLMEENGNAEQATHAWVEIFINDLGGVGFDPSHNKCIDEGYVRVCCGLDSLDSSMIKGVKTNFNGDENLKVDVSISNCQ